MDVAAEFLGGPHGFEDAGDHLGCPGAVGVVD